MKCAKCPLFTSWSNESDRGESCGLFGDAWDNSLQYEDKNGDVVGCYVDRHYIAKADREYIDHLEREGETWIDDWKEANDER